MKDESRTYWQWLRIVARMTFPMRHDFAGIWEGLTDFVRAVVWCVSVLFMRVLLLLTLPVSGPLLARWMHKREAYVIAEKKRQREKLISQLQGDSHG